jgi:hypothetical protein
MRRWHFSWILFMPGIQEVSAIGPCLVNINIPAPKTRAPKIK